MRLTRSFYRTFKEVPKDARIPSHQLMFRTGMIQQLASGIYSYLPLALRSLRKIETIIRDELNQRGCEEVLMPAVLPATLWQESGRWNAYGDLLLRFRDRKGNDYCIGPTHEEAFTDMVRRQLNSWKQLPWNLYQIQDKFRDEFRPRFGLMRGREFFMKDAYSFDLDEQAAAKSYQLMYEAYKAIFTRCGLRFRAVDAAAGEIGGSMSHEFQVLASSGEDVLLSCGACSYAVNSEKAAVLREFNPPDKTQFKDRKIVATPGQKTIEEVSKFLGVKPENFLKRLVYEADSNLFLVVIAGNLDVNETKLQAVLKAGELCLASSEKVKKAVGADPGFIGPVNLLPNMKIIADFSATRGENWISGANQNDKHIVNINLERDFQVNEFADIAFAVAGDTCPECKEGRMEEFRGIEVGHVFYLGTKYSETMNCCYRDEKGNSKPVEMGCYGIGIGRTMAAAIEQNHDENGIIWPVPLAPWEAIILPLQMNNETVISAAEKIYTDLTQADIETVLDDRNERPGFKFKDADLVGYPVQIVLGERSAAEGKVEIKFRASGEKTELLLAEATDYIIRWVKDKR